MKKNIIEVKRISNCNHKCDNINCSANGSFVVDAYAINKHFKYYLCNDHFDELEKEILKELPSMSEKELVIKYLGYIKDLEKYYKKNNKEIEDYVAIWKSLEKGDEVEQLRFVFNNEPNLMTKYIGVIDYISEVLLDTATLDKEVSDRKKGNKLKLTKSYYDIFYGYDSNDYLNDSDLSDSTKELSKIYFNFKKLESDLYSWLKSTRERKSGYTNFENYGIFI